MEVGTQARTAREARKSHAEHKGGKLGGSQEQRTIKEFLAKIKEKKKNSTDGHPSHEKPREGGTPKDSEGGVRRKQNSMGDKPFPKTRAAQ